MKQSRDYPDDLILKTGEEVICTAASLNGEHQDTQTFTQVKPKEEEEFSYTKVKIFYPLNITFLEAVIGKYPNVT